MFCRETPNGKFRFVEYYRDPMTLKKREVSVTLDKNTNASRKEAARVLQKKIENALNSLYVKDDKIRLGEVINRFVAYQYDHHKASTAMQDKMHLVSVEKLIGSDCIFSRLTTPTGKPVGVVSGQAFEGRFGWVSTLPVEVMIQYMFVVIAYDVNTETMEGQKRLRKIAKKCVNYGQRVQNSVFECSVDAAQYRILKAELFGLMDPSSDSLKFYKLGNAYKDKIEHYGVKKGYDPTDTLIL